MIRRLFLLIILSFFLSGCFPSIDRSGTKGDLPDFVKGQVVKGFPALPFYEGAEIVESYGYRGNFGASFVTGDDLGRVVKFYEVGLLQLGWEATLTQNSPTNYQFRVKNAQNDGTVIINTAADGKQTAITMSAWER